MNELVTITAEQYQEISAAIVAVDRLAAPFHYKLVERNYLALSDTTHFVSVTIAAGRGFARPDRKQLGESVMAAAANFLSSFRLFLDHEETDIKRRWGKSSAAARRFSLATSQAYDKHLGYRFAYKFRNYVQHCGLPLSRIRLSAAKNSTDRQNVELLLDRSSLISEFDAWGAVAKDLATLESEFPLLPLMTDAMEGLREVNKVCVQIDIDDAITQSHVLAQALDQIGDEPSLSEQPVVLSFDEEGDGRLHFSPRPIPVAAVTTLCGIANGTDSPDSLIPATLEKGPQLSMESAGQRLRYKRGAEILALWLVEGGGTPNFMRSVNTIIEQDRGIEPLITGLINIGTVLLHMAASSIGTSPEALLAGMDENFGAAVDAN